MGIEEKIKANIMEKGLKFSYVAEKVGISNDWLSKSLSGKRRLTANEFISICEVLNLDLKDFNNTA